MILSRLTHALREQNWLAVGIEFIIVVAGVVIGFQISAWNEARQTRTSLIGALEQAREEVRENIGAAEFQIGRIEGFADDVNTLIGHVGACTPPDENDVPLGQIVLLLGNDFSPTYDDSSLSHLLGNETFVPFLSEDVRIALNSYKARLVEDREQHAINFNLMWDNHIIAHRFIGTDMAGGLESASLRLAVPFETACQDPDFQRRFLMTAAFLNSFGARMLDFTEQAETTQAALQAELDRIR